MKEGISIREGDVYRWCYKNDTEYRASCGGGTAYWCMDNQAIVRNGELIDTYWDGIQMDRLSSNSTYLKLDKVDLEFVCNVNDVKFVNKWEAENYDTVYNLSHQKGSYVCYAVDKNANVSTKALRIKYQLKLDEAESDKRYAEWDIERYTQLLTELG